MSVRYRPSSISATPEHVVSAKVQKQHLRGSCMHRLFCRGFHVCESCSVALECSPTGCDQVTLGVMIDSAARTAAGRHPTFVTLGFKMREPVPPVVVANYVRVYVAPHGGETWPAVVILEQSEPRQLARGCGGTVSWISDDISACAVPWDGGGGEGRCCMQFWCSLKVVVSLDVKR